LNQDKRYNDAFVRMTKHRSIFLTEDFSKQMSTTLCSMLLYLDTRSKDPIKLYISSNGGDLSSMYQVYDAMQMIESPINTICIGKAYSAGAVILASGTKGMRQCMKNANVMIHGIQLVFPVQPDHDSYNSENYLSHIEQLNENLFKILSLHTNKSLDQVRADCSRDLFLDAKKALDYGIVDSII